MFSTVLLHLIIHGIATVMFAVHDGSTTGLTLSLATTVRDSGANSSIGLVNFRSLNFVVWEAKMIL